MRKKIVAFSLAAAVFILPVLTTSAESVTKEEQKLKEIQKQEKEKEKELDALKPSFDKAKKELEEIDKQVSEKKANIDQINQDIAKKETELKKQQQILDERLARLYMNGTMGYMKELLEAENIHQFFVRLEMIRIMVQDDNYYLNEVKTIKQQLEKNRAAKQKELKELEPLLAEAQEKYKKMETEYNKVKDELEKLEHQEELTEEAIRKAREDMAAASNQRGDYKASGRFMWPTAGGKLTSPYGPRNGRMHKGIDIGNSLGKPIYASDGGVVTRIKSDPNGYGMYIVISHGNGYSSLYAHMYANTIRVSVGQKVAKGQVIADIGNNGRSSGPHLHFEIMKNGQNVNPSHYVSK